MKQPLIRLLSLSMLAASAGAWAQGSGPDTSQTKIVSPQEQRKEIDAKGNAFPHGRDQQ